MPVSKIENTISKVCNAFEPVKMYKYGFITEVNDGVSNEYPLTLLDKNYTGFDNISTYGSIRNFKLWILDNYDSDKRDAVAYSTKQAELEKWLRQIAKEIYRQCTESNTDWLLINDDNLVIETFDRTHVDSLIGANITLSFQVNAACEEGTFNY